MKDLFVRDLCNKLGVAEDRITNEQLNSLGLVKVDMSGGCYVTATYYNPAMDECVSVLARDYEYDDCSRDNDSIYYARINEDVRRAYLHANGAILEGDTVVVVSGRKLPKFSTHVVCGKRDITDRYYRWVATYLVFTDGLSTDEKNCRLVCDAVNEKEAI